MDSENNKIQEKAEELAKKQGQIFNKIGYKPNAGNNRSVFGGFFEDVVMEFIVNKLNGKNLKVKTGLIKKNEKFSPQIDIIVYSGNSLYESPVTPTVVVNSENVKLIVEVKAIIDKTKLENTITQIEKIKKFCPIAKTCVFTSYLSMRIEPNEVKNKFNFVDNFVILERNYKKNPFYDYGNGLESFIKTLENL
ncbi:MAG: DUF6602 domain-containing protein [Endomicrobiia bacterium]